MEMNFSPRANGSGDKTLRTSSSRDSTGLAIEASLHTPRFRGIGFSSRCPVPRWCENRQRANVALFSLGKKPESGSVS
ncbi:hypothetical protein TNCV_4976481 [Trichonephila clavipes]|nr:hypothetical protein TNCV_4976481 [Trichonephila clavipes]